MSSAKILSAEADKARGFIAPTSRMLTLYTLAPLSLWRQVRKEHISFWLVCFYLIFEYVRPQTIYPSINFLPWTAAFAVGALLASFADKEVKPPGNRLSKLIVAYGIIVLLSSTLAYDPSLSFDHLGDYFNWVIIYFAIVRTVRTKERFFIFFVLYMLCNFKMSQHGFRSWISRGFKFDIDGVGGSPGWFQNSGEFGIQLCIFTPMMVALILTVQPYCKKWIVWGLYLVPVTAVASVIASSSRGALFGLVASAIWSLRTTKYFLRALFLVVFLVAVTYYVIPPESKARFESSGSDKTSIHRLDRWHKGWETMLEYPLFGVGHKNWEEYYRDHLDYGVPGTPLVHNMFVESGTEHGFIGLGTLVFIIISMFAVDARTRKLGIREGDRFSVLASNGLDAATIGLVVSASFVTVLYYPYVWIHAAFVSALSGTVRFTGENK